MIFYLLANFLKLNFFSAWTTINKHSFVIIFGTFVWSLLWQITRLYTGTSIVLSAIHSGFYYLVVADLYTFFMTSSKVYDNHDNNINNHKYHDLNYYGTLEMQPLKPLMTGNTIINDVKQEEVQVDNNVSMSSDDTVSEVIDDKIEDKLES